MINHMIMVQIKEGISISLSLNDFGCILLSDKLNY